MSTHESEPKALQHKFMSPLVEHGLKFAVTDSHTYMFNKKRGLEEVKKNASLSLKKLEALGDKQILVGLTGTGVDVIIKTAEVHHDLLATVYECLPIPIAKARTNDGDVYFVKSMGIAGRKLPGITICGAGDHIVLPEKDEWLTLLSESPDESIVGFNSALMRWDKHVASELAVEHEKTRERSEMERREYKLITGQSSLLKKSLTKIKSTHGLKAINLAHKQAFHLGHHTNDDARLNRAVIASIMALLVRRSDLTELQIFRLEESLERSLKNGVEHQRRSGGQ